MSWIQRELKRRAAATKRAEPRQAPTSSAAERMQDLWSKLERANEALPVELRLQVEPGTREVTPTLNSLEEVTFLAWLRGENGGALGFAADGVRYVWPKPNRRRSNNFWIRWDIEKDRYLVIRRVETSTSAAVTTYTFDDSRADHMIKCLVLGKRVRVRSVRKKRLWLF
jgi:hypothetical protein